MNNLGLKWVAKIKRNIDKSIHKHKLRFIIEVFNQNPNVDFKKTYSLVIKASKHGTHILMSIMFS